MKSSAAESVAAWRSRITGYGTEAADQLQAHPKNWRLHDKHQQEALRDVLDEVGWVQNILVNQRTGYVIDGHARVALAISRGETDVPVTYVDLSEEEEALVLATLDPLSAMAGTDREKHDALMAEVAASSERMAEMMAAYGHGDVKAGLTDPDDVPEPPAEPVSQRGDLWLLGDHKVFCGDATEADDVTAVMGGKLATCMWTDPPYGVSYQGGTEKKLTIQNDDSAGLGTLLAGAFAAVDPVLLPGAAIYIAHPAGANSAVFIERFLAQGWLLRQGLVWVKDRLVLGHADYQYRHEPMLFGYRPGYAGRRGRGGEGWYGGNDATSVFEFPTPARNEDHPTTKPVGLVAAMVANSTARGDTVLDPFLGSGSTLIACEQLGRRCFGLELDPRYADVVVARWEGHSGRKAERA